VFEVGIKYVPNQTVCKDLGECKAENPSLEPGVIYEARAKVESPVPWVKPEGHDELWEVFKKVRSQYPGVAINYLYADEDGNVVIQMFDPGGELAPYAIIAILALILTIGIVSLMILKYVTEVTIPTVGKEVPKPPFGGKWLWVVGAVCATAVSVGYLMRSFRK